MSAFSRFEIDMAVSAIVFVALLLFVTRKRERKANATMLKQQVNVAGQLRRLSHQR